MLFLKKYRYVILGLIAFFALFYWIIEGGELVADKPLEQIKQSNTIIKDSSLTQDKDGKKSWDLDVKVIEIDTQTDINKLTDVKGKLFGEDGTTLDVTAKGGTYNPHTKEITLTGDVFAVYSKGWTLKCQNIQWLPDKNLIIAKEDVICEKQDLYISGDELQTDPQLVKMKITGNGTVIKRS